VSRNIDPVVMFIANPIRAERNQLVQRRDRNPLRQPEQPKVEDDDGAEEQAQADEVNALGKRPSPLRSHEFRDGGRRRRQKVHEPDLERCQRIPNS